MMNFRVLRIGLRSILLLALGCVNAWAADSELTVSQFGIGGRLHLGRWTPVRVTIAPPPERESIEIEIEAPDAEGNRAIRTQRATATAKAGEYEFLLRTGRLGSRIQFRASDGETRLGQTSLVLPETTDAESPILGLKTALYATCCSNGEFGALVADAFADFETVSGQAVHVVSLDDLAQLPRNAIGWEAMQVLLLSDHFSLEESTVAALVTWVKQGGHLILGIGDDAETFRGSSLAEQFSIAIGGEEIPLRDLTELESFAGLASRISTTRRVPGRIVDPASFDDRLFGSLEGPLAGTKLFGFGRVTVVALNIHAPPISTWESFDRFLRELSFPRINRTLRETETSSKQLTQTGISELTTQLNLAQQSFPTVRRSSTWTVLGAMFAFLLVIGPIDYLLVHRLFKRPELTWLTYPLWIGGLVCVAFWAGTATNAVGTQLNQIDLVDIDQSGRRVGLRSWSTSYSPATQRVAISATATVPEWTSGAVADEARLLWDAIPEDGFRGLYRKSGLEFTRSSYHFADEGAALDDLPIAQWSTRSQRLEQTVAELSLVESDLEASSLGSVSGTISHVLPGTITNWILAYRNRVYFPRPTRLKPEGIGLPADQPIELTRGDLAASRDLKGFLTGTRQIRIIEDSVTKSKTPETRIVVKQDAYDPFTKDVPTIVRMLSFHEAAGGKSYTGLNNFATAELDWSRMLDGHHAILFGQLELADEANVVAWHWNGATIPAGQKHVFVRVLLPVALSTDVRRELPDLDKRLKESR